MVHMPRTPEIVLSLMKEDLVRACGARYSQREYGVWVEQVGSLRASLCFPIELLK